MLEINILYLIISYILLLLYMSTLYTPTILNSELNYLMILVNLIILSKICYYMSAYNILPINIYDSNWQFCYCKIIV